MNLIDDTYFIREIHLPGENVSGNNEDLAAYITQYEKEVLTELLGYDLYKALKVEIDKGPGNYDEPWKSFIEGAEYTVESGSEPYTVKWNGLTNTELISLISYYIYFNYMRDLVTKTAMIGETLSLAENSQRISPSDKMANAWNRHLELYGSRGDGLLVPSAYRYLTENEDDFDKWVFTDKEPINSFDI
jgi:hypothetical protein